MLSVMGFIFFILMLLDSLYEGLAPISRTYGVARINTRLSFYAYERQILRDANAAVAILGASVVYEEPIMWSSWEFEEDYTIN